MVRTPSSSSSVAALPALEAEGNCEMWRRGILPRWGREAEDRAEDGADRRLGGGTITRPAVGGGDAEGGRRWPSSHRAASANARACTHSATRAGVRGDPAAAAAAGPAASGPPAPAISRCTYAWTSSSRHPQKPTTGGRRGRCPPPPPPPGPAGSPACGTATAATAVADPEPHPDPEAGGRPRSSAGRSRAPPPPFSLPHCRWATIRSAPAAPSVPRLVRMARERSPPVSNRYAGQYTCPPLTPPPWDWGSATSTKHGAPVAATTPACRCGCDCGY